MPGPTPTEYYPNMGSSARRFAEVVDPNAYPNQGSSLWDLVPSAGGISSPDEITGLVVWLDADDATTVNAGSPVNTDPVDTWANKGSLGGSFSATGTERPTYSTGLQNGKPGIFSDGTDDMESSFTTSLKPVTIFAVTHHNDSHNAVIVGGSSAGGLGFQFEEIVGAPTTFQLEAFKQGTGLIGDGTSTTIALAATAIYEFSYGAAGAYDFFINGTADGSGTNDQTINTVNLRIMANQNGDNHIDGPMHELLIYSSVLSAGDRANVRSYLTTKWGL